MAKDMSYDEKSWDLAGHFLADEEFRDDKNRRAAQHDLAQRIQGCIEDFLSEMDEARALRAQMRD